MKVLKFGAIWCPGCLVMRPLWQKIEAENPSLQTEYFDYDTDKEMVEKWNIGKDIPVFIFIDKECEELERLIGEHSKKEILELIEKYLDK